MNNDDFQTSDLGSDTQDHKNDDKPFKSYTLILAKDRCGNSSTGHQSARSTKLKHIADLKRLKENQKYLVIEMNGQYQYRIDGILDVYPTNSRYHHIPLQMRGRFKSIDELIRKFLKRKNKQYPANKNLK